MDNCVVFTQEEVNGELDFTQLQVINADCSNPVKNYGEAILGIVNELLTINKRLESKLESTQKEVSSLRKELHSTRLLQQQQILDGQQDESQSLLDENYVSPGSILIGNKNKRKVFTMYKDMYGSEKGIYLTTVEQMEIQGLSNLQAVVRKGLLHFHDIKFLRGVTLTGDQRTGRPCWLTNTESNNSEEEENHKDSDVSRKQLPVDTNVNAIHAIVGERFKDKHPAPTKAEIRSKITRVLADFFTCYNDNGMRKVLEKVNKKQESQSQSEKIKKPSPLSDSSSFDASSSGASGGLDEEFKKSVYFALKPK